MNARTQTFDFVSREERERESRRMVIEFNLEFDVFADNGMSPNTGSGELYFPLGAVPQDVGEVQLSSGREVLDGDDWL
jgi:hypothetical protein